MLSINVLEAAFQPLGGPTSLAVFETSLIGRIEASPKVVKYPKSLTERENKLPSCKERFHKWHIAF